jgi:hypothetical protein
VVLQDFELWLVDLDKSMATSGSCLWIISFFESVVLEARLRRRVAISWFTAFSSSVPLESMVVLVLKQDAGETERGTWIHCFSNSALK